MWFDHTPKAELHLHLEGSLDPETLLEIDPSLTADEITANTAYSDFAGFLKAFVWENKLLCKPEHYALAARRLIGKLASQNVVYAEITLSAGVVLWKKQNLEDVYEAIWEESRKAAFPVYWILDAVRQFGPDPALPVVDFAAAHIRQGVVAFGIGGDEARGPASSFRDIFRRAKDAGLRLTCHAGETCGPESIWEAVEVGAERIGHGIASVDDASLLTHLRERAIPLEVSVSSNVRTGAVASLEAHPVRKIFDAGVPIVVGTDDPALFDTSLRREYEILARHFGFSEDELKELAATSLRYAFRW
jgi:adenosine deaminase/aminodeoxyfutalosine deaminase